MTISRAVLITFVATLALAWATWALFLAPRKGGDSIEAMMETIAADLRAGDFDAVRELLDPAFTFSLGGSGRDLAAGSLDRDETLAFAQREHLAGRFYPYVALTHLIPIDDGDVKNVAVLGILATAEPEKKRDVNLVSVRLEVKVKKTDAGWRVLSARSHLGR
jgi:hypothetical protein